MPIHIDVQEAWSEREKYTGLPNVEQLRLWVQRAAAPRQNIRICIRFVDKEEIQLLNQRYRHKDKVTNILSFPSQHPKTLARGQLGDLVLCPTVIFDEIKRYQKDTEAYFAHLIVHGTLHLLGYDHIQPEETEKMEALEKRVITSLGYPPPYEKAE